MQFFLVFIFIGMLFCSCCIGSYHLDEESDMDVSSNSNIHHVTLGESLESTKSELTLTKATKDFLVDIGVDELTIKNIAMDDSRVQKMLQEGGEIEGIVVSCPPGPKDDPYPGCWPAFRINYKIISVDFLVDADSKMVVKTVLNAPSGSHHTTIENKKYVILPDGELIYDFTANK